MKPRKTKDHYHGATGTEFSAFLVSPVDDEAGAMKDMKTISDRIFELMKERGMSQKTFSEKTGIAQSTISVLLM